MRKLVIGASRALSAQPLGTLGEEHVFFDSHGLGKQANPVLHASHIRGTTAAAGCFVRPESGIECLTLVLHGALDVQDSAGHHAHLQAGDAEWSTAGHGTLHRYAGATDTPVEALSVWLNLPAAYKSTPPHSQPLRAADIPPVPLPDDAGSARIIAGEWQGQIGPAETATPVQCWDVHLRAGHTLDAPLPRGWYASALIVAGEAAVDFWPGSLAAPSLVFFDAAGDQVQIHALADTRLLLLSAAPLEEPLATADAIVSNSPAELEQALEAIRTGLWGSLPA